MKFLYSDTQDLVDPHYDFLADKNAPGREPYWGEVYAHELMSPAPYDGLLVAMSALRQAEGVAKSKVRYSTAEEQRFLRVGARRYLRFDGAAHRELMLMGDCGAFAYVEHSEPAYSPAEVVEFYLDAGFTHGVSPDHVIFQCHLENPTASEVPKEATRRYEITLANAEEFRRLVFSEGTPFEPIAAVQGWSPASMAKASKTLIRMGYQYLAVGGLVPLRVEAIHAVLRAIREAIGPQPKLHLLGFAKADHIDAFTGYDIASFDSTSPLIRAFKDEKSNYYMDKGDGTLEYYTAIRIPQALENTRLMHGVKKGIFDPVTLLAKERVALDAVRAFDRMPKNLDGTVGAVMDYYQFLLYGENVSAVAREKAMLEMTRQVRRTLEHSPWKSCRCDVCRAVGVEVIIFRSSNRNKRRGFHNLSVYHRHLQKALERVA